MISNFPKKIYQFGSGFNLRKIGENVSSASPLISVVCCSPSGTHSHMQNDMPLGGNSLSGRTVLLNTGDIVGVWARNSCGRHPISDALLQVSARGFAAIDKLNVYGNPMSFIESQRAEFIYSDPSSLVLQEGVMAIFNTALGYSRSSFGSARLSSSGGSQIVSIGPSILHFYQRIFGSLGISGCYRKLSLSKYERALVLVQRPLHDDFLFPVNVSLNAGRD